MNSQEYLEVAVKIVPFSETNAEIIIAEVEDLPFDSFSVEEPYLKCYMPAEKYDRQALKAVMSGIDGSGGFSADYTVALVPAANWNREWEKESFDPIVVDGLCTIKSPLHKNLKKTRFNITIEPGMAFGTGHHDTTRLMCRAMFRHEDFIKGKTVLDMGCGTAVLAILAAKMGACRVYGIDIDAVAAASAFGNAIRNRVSKRVETYCGDASLLQMGKYDVILANINRNILVQDMGTYSRSLKKGGLLIVSGFFEQDRDIVVRTAEEHGLLYVGDYGSDGWSCVEFNRQK